MTVAVPYMHTRNEVKHMKISTQRIDIRTAELGLTFAKLAERCGMSRQGLSIVRTRGTCTPATAAKLCTGLECKIEDILPGRKDDAE